jgi:hypothetical protein
LGEARGRKPNDQTIVKTFVVLIRNTTWRCGKQEKAIVTHLHKRNEDLGKDNLSIKDIMYNLKINNEKKDECIDALKRLEKRNIVKLILPTI